VSTTPDRAQLRTDARASREQIVTTVREMRSAVDQAKAEAIEGAKRKAPVVLGAFAVLVLLRMSMRRSRRR
jgi:hypothetical protein